MDNKDILLFIINQLILCLAFPYFQSLLKIKSVKEKYTVLLIYLSLFPISLVILFLPSFYSSDNVQFFYFAEQINVVASFQELSYLSLSINLVILASVLLIVYKLTSLYKLYMQKFNKIEDNRYHADIYSTNFFNVAFSFKILKSKIIIPENYFIEFKNSEVDMIIEHEMIHLKRNDFYINIIQKLIKYAFFYNPIVRKIDKEIDLIREVIVDSEVIHQNEIDKKNYMNLLIYASKKTQLNVSPDLIVPFSDNYTIIKRRIIMLNENLSERSPKSNYITLSLGVLVMLFLFSCNKEMAETDYIAAIQNNDEVAYFEADTKPEVIKRGKIVYPEEAIKKGIEGTVTVMFIVNKEGLPENIEIVKGDEIFHKSTINAIKGYQFKPAIHKGKKVKVKWAMPIKYALKKEAVLIKPIVFTDLNSEKC